MSRRSSSRLKNDGRWSGDYNINKTYTFNETAFDAHTHTHTVNGTRKVKPIWILLKQETVSGSGISWAICKSAPRSRQITMPAPHHSVFTGRMPFLPPNQQRQSTEGNKAIWCIWWMQVNNRKDSNLGTSVRGRRVSLLKIRSVHQRKDEAQRATP